MFKLLCVCFLFSLSPVLSNLQSLSLDYEGNKVTDYHEAAENRQNVRDNLSSPSVQTYKNKKLHYYFFICSANTNAVPLHRSHRALPSGLFIQPPSPPPTSLSPLLLWCKPLNCDKHKSLHSRIHLYYFQN